MFRSKPFFAANTITYFLVESILIALAVWGAHLIRFPWIVDAPISKYVTNPERIVCVVAVLQTVLYYNGMYDRNSFRPMDVFFKLLISLLISAGALTIFYYILPVLSLGRGVFILSLSLCMLFLLSARLLQMYLFGVGRFGQRVVILGTGDRAMEIAHLLIQKKGSGYTLLGFVESDQEWMARKSRKAEKHVLTIMDDNVLSSAKGDESETIAAPNEQTAPNGETDDKENAELKRLPIKKNSVTSQLWKMLSYLHIAGISRTCER